MRYGEGRGRQRGRVRSLLDERCAQGTLEYALTVAALLSIMLACAALWRASADGALAQAVQEAASHVLAGTGPLDIALY